MNMFKKIITAVGVLTVIGISSVTAFATSVNQTPANTAADFTDRSVQGVIKEHIEIGKSYGNTVTDTGMTEEFQKAMPEMEKDYYPQIVEEDILATDQDILATDYQDILATDQEDSSISVIENRQVVCDGTGICGGICDHCLDYNYNNGNMSNGNNNAANRNNNSSIDNSNGHHGNGRGHRSGNGLRDGSCLYQ